MEQNNKGLLSRLTGNHVEFVIIGGYCAVLHGVSLVTFDLGVCIRFTTANLKRLEIAVKDLHPCHRLTANKLPLELTDELISGLKNLYLQTDLGKLDCLGEVSGVGDYEQVSEQSVNYQSAFGEFRMLNIDALIAAKSALGRDRDLAAVKQLCAIKEKNRAITT